ncbi:class I SAM-dependent methyltransferase [Viridibacillus sp. NPDC096237]|uniref:class I SAM-dependent methyltransferase n=1 Tax=Viridibacillus sp. NPDC096237 TaxID=3390721 RepID=UPI003D076833
MGREFIYLFDEWAKSYEESVTGQHKEYRDVFEGYESILEKVANASIGTVIEFGTGTGNLTLKLEAAGREVIGIEPHETMREITGKRCPNVQLVDGDLQNFTVENKHIDSIVSTYVFHHLTDEEKLEALKTYAKLLQPGGKIIFADTAFVSEEHKKAQIKKERSRGYHEVADDLEREYYTTITKLLTMFQEASFDVSFEQLNDYVWYMEAIKKST